MRGSQAIVLFLEAVGVSQTFGVVGESVLDFVDAVRDDAEIEYVPVRHEQAGALAASGFTRTAFEPAVCIGHIGAGASNLVNGMADAYKDNLPVMALTGNTETAELGRNGWHEVDHLAMFNPVTEWSVRIEHAERIPQVMREAMNRLNTGAPGPIHIDLPTDIATTELPPAVETEVREALSSIPGPRTDRNRVRPAETTVDRAVDQLIEAENPVVLAGGETAWSDVSDALVELVEYGSIPVLTSLTARGVLSEHHKYCFGGLGTLGRIAAKEVADDADFLLALGTGLTDVETFGYSLFENTAIVQVSLREGALARQYSIDEGVLADPAAFVDAFENRLRERTDGPLDEPARMDEYRAQFNDEIDAIIEPDDEATGNTNTGLVSPYAPLSAIAAAKAPEDIICSASGKNTLWSSLIPIERPGTFLKSVGLGTMGFAFPAGIGARIADRDTNVFVVIGDGDFSMVAQELETCVRKGLSLIIVVFNDSRLSSIKVHQAQEYDEQFIGVDYTDVDFASVAEGFGADGIRVEQGERFADALETALTSNGPTVIDTTIDPEVQAPSLYYET
jgi:acetolactate synthase-1/2/3 large subunit